MTPPKISAFTLAFFRLITRVWFHLHFTSVLTLDVTPFTAASATTPLIVYGNHSSWWDPMIAVLLAARLMPGRAHYAPIDATSLAENRILAKIGLFPLDIRSPRGAAQFLRASIALLQQSGVLWVTPQGRFADTREPTLTFKPGLAALAARFPSGCTLIPLATEYPFWNQRRPHALAHFGPAITLTGPPAAGQLEQALQLTMDELKARSLTRDPASFTPLPLWRKAPQP